MYDACMNFGDCRQGNGSSPSESTVSRVGKGGGGGVEEKRGQLPLGGDVPTRRCCDQGGDCAGSPSFVLLGWGMRGVLCDLCRSRPPGDGRIVSGGCAGGGGSLDHTRWAGGGGPLRVDDNASAGGVCAALSVCGLGSLCPFLLHRAAPCVSMPCAYAAAVS